VPWSLTWPSSGRAPKWPHSRKWSPQPAAPRPQFHRPLARVVMTADGRCLRLGVQAREHVFCDHEPNRPRSSQGRNGDGVAAQTWRASWRTSEPGSRRMTTLTIWGQMTMTSARRRARKASRARTRLPTAWGGGRCHGGHPPNGSSGERSRTGYRSS
jgi:hypothetical protein